MKTIRRLIYVAIVGTIVFALISYFRSPDPDSAIGGAIDGIGDAVDATTNSIGGMGRDLKGTRNRLEKDALR